MSNTQERDLLDGSGSPIDPRAAQTNQTPSRVSRKSGDGSLSKSESWSEEKASEHSVPNDGRYDTRTTFYYDTSGPRLEEQQKHRDPQDRRSWEEMAKWNDGMWDSDRYLQNLSADRRRWAHTFCNFLELSSHITTEAISLSDEIEGDEFGTIPDEHVIIGIISLLVDNNEDNDPQTWTPDDWFIYRDDFEELMDDLEMRRERLWTVRRLVHEKTDRF